MGGSVTSPNPETTPIRDAWQKLIGADQRPLPPDDEVYSSGPVVFIPRTRNPLLASTVRGPAPANSAAYQNQGVVSFAET
jgi:hypothetical protein